MVTVVGGVNVDVKGHGDTALLPDNSNPGTVTITAGGVGRNIAENLARMGVETVLLSAVGDDRFGGFVIEETRRAGVLTDLFLRASEKTGVYVAITNSRGTLHTAVNDMRICQAISPDYISSCESVIESSSFIIADTNIPVESLVHLSRLASRLSIPFLVEPVSIQKGRKINAVSLPISFITPNLAEYLGLMGPETPGASYTPDALPRSDASDMPETLDRTTRTNGKGGPSPEELKRELPHISAAVITLGAEGSMLLDAKSGTTLRVPSIPVAVVDPNGAGDAFVAGFVAGLLLGKPTARAMACGAAAASLTLASSGSVNREISMERVMELAASVRNP